MNRYLRRALFFTGIIFAAAAAGDLSDSLYIEGYFSQEGERVSRRTVEKFLLDRNAGAVSIDKSKGYWWSSWAVGAAVWSVNAGYSAYQAGQAYNAIQRGETFSAAIDRFTVPLVLGSEIAAFVQGVLRTRSDYWLHKGVTDYNRSIAGQYPDDTLMDHSIRKAKAGRYVQDYVLIPPRIVNPLLRETDASWPFAYWSGVTGELARQTIGIGSMFLFLALIGYIEQEGVEVNTHQRDIHLGVGIGLTGFGIISSAVSSITQKAGIKRYNESVKKMR